MSSAGSSVSGWGRDRETSRAGAMGGGQELVFVYGSLRQGASNHFRMEGAEPLGEAVITGELYRIDWYPGVILSETGNPVHGEVYRVGPELLARLDRFEGVRGREDDEYARVRVMARAEGRRRHEVWVYEYRGAVQDLPRLPGGDWLLA